MLRTPIFLLTVLFCQLVQGQPKPKTDESPVKAIPFFENLEYRLIGPFRGGRSAAVAGSNDEKNVFYFGGTGGGVWKTSDGGNNWKNISDGSFGGSIGAICVAPSDKTIIYVGEGENTLRGNVSEGLNGIWRSEDGGRSWQNRGLQDGRHIIRILVHPKNPDIVWAAVVGHLFGPNKTRGIFKSIDGGRNWKQVLFVNDQTGASDLVMEPGNPKILYAGTWRIIRQPHSMESGGEGSGLWRSTDGGETWENISKAKGLPRGIWGIVGVAIAPSNPETLYTIIENEKGGLYASDDGGKTWELRSSDNNIRQRAWYYSKVFVDPKNENLVYCPNVQFMFSVDGGRNFKSLPTPHGDHHDLWIDPENGKRMIVADDGGAQVSFDGGLNWSTYLNQPTAQVYRISADNAFPYHVMGGQQDNEAFRIKTRTYGQAITAADLESAAGSESGYVVADPLNPDITYGGNYHGMLMRLNHKTNEYRLINVWPIDNMGAGADSARYRFQWNFPIFFSPHNPKRLYAAGNHLFVTENEGRSWQTISPDLTTNDKSKQVSSGGPITKDNTSVEYYCTIFTAAESSLEKDLLWSGSDDGLIYVSRNGGQNWQNVTPKDIPNWMMWNSVEVDPHQKGCAYFVGTRYKLDDFSPYVFKTENYGATWKRIDAGLPRMHFTRTIRADKVVPNLLYLGTEYGMYMSYDGGKNWNSFQLNLPQVPITDMIIKNNDLVVATQGRSIYIIDDLTAVQQYRPENNGNQLQLFSPAPAYRMAPTGSRRRRTGGVEKNVGLNPPQGVSIPFYLSKVDDSTKAEIVIYDASKKLITKFNNSNKEKKLEVQNGLNYFTWDLLYPEGEKVPSDIILWNRVRMAALAPPGKYFAKLTVNQDSLEVPFSIIADPNYSVSQQEYEDQFSFLRKIQDRFDEVVQAQKNIQDIRNQLKAFQERSDSSLPKNIKEEITRITEKMTAIEEALHQTKAKSSQDVLNYPIRLDDKLSSIYGTAAAGNGAPTQQSREAFEVVNTAIDIELQKLKVILDTDLLKLNQLIRENSIPTIGIKKK